MAIGRSPEIIFYRLRQCLFGLSGATPASRAARATSIAIRRETCWISLSSGNTGPVGSVARGEQSASARLALISIASVTLLAPEAIIPSPIPGKM